MAKTKVPIFGWDSEYYNNELIERQEVISHQLYDLETGDEIFIDCIKDGAIVFADLVSRIKKSYPDMTELILVTHFSRAEFSALEDGREMILGSDSFLSSKTIAGTYNRLGVKINLYDTYQFFPLPLQQLGEWIGVKKINIGEYRSDRIIELYRSNFELFHQYAMTDAKIPALVFQKLMEFSKELGLKTLPWTGGSVGSSILSTRLKRYDGGAERLGYYLDVNKCFTGGKLYPKTSLKMKKQTEDRYTNLLYGGRNELYLRGYFPDGEVFVYDLRSAYVSAQSTIGEFDFSNPMIFNDPLQCYEFLDEHPFSFGHVEVEKVRHKADCQFPILIHKINDSAVFVLESDQYTMLSHEFYSAYETFEEIVGFRAVIYPQFRPDSIIADFQKEIAKRRDAAKKEGNQLKDNFLKNVGNSTYGKFAQGYSERKSINLKRSRKGDIRTENMPKSSISNPFIACYITSLIRGIAFETLNHLHNDLTIPPLNWTTDGFAVFGEVPNYVIKGSFGKLARHLADHLEQLTGNRAIFELKNVGGGWIGIKTRGYTILRQTGNLPLLSSITGIQNRGMSKTQKAAFIETEFTNLTRFKDTNYLENTITPLKDWLNDKIYKNTLTKKGYNWDYDFKRMPDLSQINTTTEILNFYTTPYRNIADYNLTKHCYTNFKRGLRNDKKQQYATKNKIITFNDLMEFIDYINKTGLTHITLKKPIIERLHLKLLSQYINHLSLKPLGFKQLAILLKQPAGTVRNWIRDNIIPENKQTILDLLVISFKLNTIFNLPSQINLNQGAICEYIIYYIVTSGTLEKELCQLYSKWSLNKEYSLNIFSYLIDFIIYLSCMELDQDYEY